MWRHHQSFFYQILIKSYHCSCYVTTLKFELSLHGFFIFSVSKRIFGINEILNLLLPAGLFFIYSVVIENNNLSLKIVNFFSLDFVSFLYIFLKSYIWHFPSDVNELLFLNNHQLIIWKHWAFTLTRPVPFTCDLGSLIYYLNATICSKCRLFNCSKVGDFGSEFLYYCYML